MYECIFYSFITLVEFGENAAQEWKRNGFENLGWKYFEFVKGYKEV